MTKHTSKYGTDDRYPHWRGGAIDPKTINGFSAIGILINWTAVFLLLSPQSVIYDYIDFTWFPFLFIFAIAVCFLTMIPLRHSDIFVQRFVRGFVCGLPIVVMIFGLLRAGMLKLFYA